MQTSARDKALRRAAMLAAVLLLAACGNPPPSQFAEFAKLGTALSDTTPPLLDAAFREAVLADSLVLAQVRETQTDPLQRLDALEENNALLLERREIYADLKQHSRLLRSYFVTLGLLADTSGDSALGTGAAGIVNQLQAISPKLQSDFALDDFVNAAAPVAIGAFRSIALKRELEARAGAITVELDLQQEVLAAIAEQMRADNLTQVQKLAREQVEQPFMQPGSLPGDWAERRLAGLQRQTVLVAVDAAAQAADNLRLSFIALVEGGDAGASLGLLLQDVSTVVSLVEALQPGA